MYIFLFGLKFLIGQQFNKFAKLLDYAIKVLQKFSILKIRYENFVYLGESNRFVNIYYFLIS